MCCLAVKYDNIQRTEFAGVLTAHACIEFLLLPLIITHNTWTTTYVPIAGYKGIMFSIHCTYKN